MKDLKYLFIAEYADGTIFKQTPQDISLLDPEKRNCFYDVLNSGKTIRRFSLTNKENTVTVDLGTGLFYVNGLAVLLEGEKLPCLPEKFELVYYHQVTRNQNVTFDKSSGDVLSRENMPEIREYFIGWQCTINGKNYQQKLAII